MHVLRIAAVLAAGIVTLGAAEEPGETGADGEPRGDEPVRLSIEQAVVTALENNRSLRAERLGPLIAGTFEERERAVFDPVVFGELAYSREQTEQLSRDIEDRFTVEGEDLRGQVGAGVWLPTGTDVEVTLDHLYSDSDRTPEQDRTRIGLSMTQALLQGRGLETNLVGIRQARLDTLASQYELRGFTETFVSEVEDVYWGLLLAREEEAIFESSLAVAEQQLDVTLGRIEVGDIPETERAAAEAEVAERRQDLIEARNRREQFRLQLLSLMDPSANAVRWETEIVLLEEPVLPDWDIGEPSEHVSLARRYRPELEEARLRLDRNELEVVQTRSGLLPRLDLFVTLGKSGFAESFGRSPRNLDSDAYDATVGVRFERAWGNREGRSTDRRARFVRQQAEEALANLEILVELDVRQALLEVDRAREQVDASAATRRLREEVLRTEQERFGVGRSTALQVAQAQRDLLAGQIAEIEALVDVRRALIQLHRLDGTLLRRRGIEL